jgi:hypothetical protein
VSLFAGQFVQAPNAATGFGYHKRNYARDRAKRAPKRGATVSSRRDFVQEFGALAALAAVAAKPGLGVIQDPKLSEFWDAYFAEATGTHTEESRGGQARSPLIDPERQVQLIHATPNGLQYPDKIPQSELRGDADNVVVTFNPGHFRPSPNDYRAIRRSNGSQVRVDWFQKQPIMNFLAPMAWAGLAAWSERKTSYDAKSKKQVQGPIPPTLQQLDFRDPNAPNAPLRNDVVLMGGTGSLAVNVRAVRFNARLHAVLDKTVNYSSIVAPFFGFAPLAIPALRAFTDLLGAVFSHEAVLMNTLPVQVLATQRAVQKGHDAEGVKIVSGDFLAVPLNQTDDLKGQFDKLRVDNGWLVHQDADPRVPPSKRAEEDRVPPVTYVVLNLSVRPLDEVIGPKAKG